MREVIHVLEVAESDRPAQEVLVQRPNQVRLHQLTVEQRFAQQPWETEQKKIATKKDTSGLSSKVLMKESYQLASHIPSSGLLKAGGDDVGQKVQP